MFKSIFSKHFTVMSLVIVVSFVAMGGMQMLFSTRYWVSEKRALLTENARNVAEPCIVYRRLLTAGSIQEQCHLHSIIIHLKIKKCLSSSSLQNSFPRQ